MTARDERAAALVQSVSERIGRREQGKPPSLALMIKAAHLLAPDGPAHKITEHVGTWRRFDVAGEDGTYLVIAQISRRGVVDAACACRAETTCFHLLAVLASLERDGIHLES